MSEREAERLLAAARAEPVSLDVLPKVRRRLDEPHTRRAFPIGWAVLVTAGLALFILRPGPQERPDLAPGVVKTHPAVGELRLAEHTTPKPKPKHSRRVVLSSPVAAPVVDEPVATIEPNPIERGGGTKPSLADVRTEPDDDPRARIASYRPRAVRELIDASRARLVERTLSAHVRRILTMTDERRMLAALDRTELRDAELLTLRGMLRASQSRCVDAISDLDLAQRMAPESVASSDAAAAARWCE